MFNNSEFNQDLTNWKPFNLIDCTEIFEKCPALVPYWTMFWNAKDITKFKEKKKLH